MDGHRQVEKIEPMRGAQTEVSELTKVRTISGYDMLLYMCGNGQKLGG